MERLKSRHHGALDAWMTLLRWAWMRRLTHSDSRNPYRLFSRSSTDAGGFHPTPLQLPSINAASGRIKLNSNPPRGGVLHDRKSSTTRESRSCRRESTTGDPEALPPLVYDLHPIKSSLAASVPREIATVETRLPNAVVVLALLMMNMIIIFFIIISIVSIPWSENPQI